MNKNLLSKTLVIGIIFLFIGVSVSSAISIDAKSTISNNESVEDCGCQDVSSQHLVRLERLLDRLEVSTKILLLLSKHNPEIAEKCQEMFDRITTITDKYEELKPKAPLDDYPIICAILESIFLPVQQIGRRLSDLGIYYYEYPMIRTIIQLMLVPLGVYCWNVIKLGLLYECEWAEPYIP